MQWNDNSSFNRSHAFLSPSKGSWINYDIDKLKQTYGRHKAAADGTRWHNFAQECIELNQRLPKNNKTVNMFVNDAIGFKMKSELILRYSDKCFGTADAISFKDNVLRIHDLKTGYVPGTTTQLDIYVAVFCLEYSMNPNDITMVCRLYQHDAVVEWNPLPTDILRIMSIIIEFDRVLTQLDREMEL